MLMIDGRAGRLCDGSTRRELLSIGGLSLLGLSIPNVLALREAQASAPAKGTAGSFGKAKNVILLFLQGGPSHIDIWDPKPDAPDSIRGAFKAIDTKVAGIQISELMPKLAQQMDKATLIRSLSYTPAGLINHTAAIYQLLTGYTPDKVSPTGQLEPPTMTDFPNAGSNIARLRPPDVPMLPFVMLPRPVQESNVINKGGTAGFLGKAYDPYYLFPAGDDVDQSKMDRVRIDDLRLRPEVSELRLERRAGLRKALDAQMPEVQKAVEKFALNKYYDQAYDLILSGRARKAFDLTQEPDTVRDRYGRHTFGQSALLARRLVEAGTRFVQVNWPSVANGEPSQTSFDTHYSTMRALKELHCPKLDTALSTLLADLHERGLLESTLVVAMGEFGRSPRLGVDTTGNGGNKADGRDHWPYCYTALVSGAGVRMGALYGKSDATGSSPAENLTHPTDVLATIYHALGIRPDTLVYNHLNQPRELVQAKVIEGLFG
ncbi:MAG TPA: DUF1501 domain-containing protein [Armatimonadota bacterium]|nr:DUF1501 domain-containing protein [Armatimonadota bacterium]